MSEKNQTSEYQNTINLPQTNFAMKADLATREPKMLEMWQKENLYGKIRSKSANKKQFILHDGPPYANGHIHIGHALNKILKDFIVKMKTMQGLDSFYLPGWDCHGLPIEHQLFKELKKHKGEVDCVDFRKKAHEYALKFVGIQRDEFKRLGVFGEWDNPYLTLNTEYEYWILKSLQSLNDKGYIYRGLKPVNWCAKCETALAEAEVEYENHTSPSVYVKFLVNNPQELDKKFSGKKVSLLVWTTTPWTLLANVAVCVHPTFTYLAVEVGGEVLIVERTLSQIVLEKCKITDYKELGEFEGNKLTKLKYDHIFGLRKNCPVVTADYVTKEDGTGLVHTAPGHGQDDYQTGIRNNLEIVMPVNDRGVYTAEAGKYEGEHVFKANEKIIEELKEKNILLASENITHSYPHCWRCKSPIIFRATKQWFLAVDHNNLRKKLADIIKTQVEWIPETGQERILGMVSLRPDWCLSRQRYWGVPIPAIECKNCGHRDLFSEVINKFADFAKKESTNSWFERDIKDFISAGTKCSKCGKSEFVKSFDILDVWFDSGVSHQAVVKGIMKKDLPVEMYLEGSDQHRGWFQSSLIPAVCIEGKAPFKAVLTHGFVVDGEGRKMSKSLGNVVAPQDIIKQSGADILRLWVASSSYNEDVRISKETLTRLSDAYRKIRNTVRYLLGNLYDFDPAKDTLAYQELLDIDKWALFKLATYVADIKTSYNKYEFANAYKLIYSFCNEDLSSFYLDILKDRLYTSAAQSKERKSAQTVLYNITNYLVRLLAPLMCYTAEEIFAVMPKDEAMKKVSSVHLLDWLDVPDDWHNVKTEEKFKILIELRPFVLKSLEDKRREGLIGSSLEAKVIFKSSSKRDLDYLKANLGLLPSAFIVSQVEVLEESVSSGLSDNFSQTQVLIEKAQGQKCPRCWNIKSDIGHDRDHQTLCTRCAANVKEISNAK